MLVQDVQHTVNDNVALQIGRLIIEKLTLEAHLAALQAKLNAELEEPTKPKAK